MRGPLQGQDGANGAIRLLKIPFGSQLGIVGLVLGRPWEGCWAEKFESEKKSDNGSSEGLTRRATRTPERRVWEDKWVSILISILISIRISNTY